MEMNSPPDRAVAAHFLSHTAKPKRWKSHAFKEYHNKKAHNNFIVNNTVSHTV